MRLLCSIKIFILIPITHSIMVEPTFKIYSEVGWWRLSTFILDHSHASYPNKNDLLVMSRSFHS
jgi:hypothetical protein